MNLIFLVKKPNVSKLIFGELNKRHFDFVVILKISNVKI